MRGGMGAAEEDAAPGLELEVLSAILCKRRVRSSDAWLRLQVLSFSRLERKKKWSERKRWEKRPSLSVA